MSEITLSRGYAYKLDLPNFTDTNPLLASNDLWDIVVIDDLSGVHVGNRIIDGVNCRIIKVGTDYYAAR